MTQTTPTPTDDAPREPADFGASLDAIDAAREPDRADDEGTEAAPPEAATPPTREPAGATTEPQAGAEPPPAAEEDPIAIARREARAEADREWQARLNGVHGNVKQLQAEVAREKARADARDAQREREYQQLIDTATTPEERRDWEDRREADRKLFAAEQVLAEAEAQKRVAEEGQQAVQQHNDRQGRVATRQHLHGFLDQQVKELGLPDDIATELRADLDSPDQLSLLAEMPAQRLFRYFQERGHWLEGRIERAHRQHQARQAEAEERQARATRQRDQRTGQYAATQAGGGGGDLPDPTRHRGTGNFLDALDDIDAVNEATGRYARR
jgi:hypothetical protein